MGGQSENKTEQTNEVDNASKNGDGGGGGGGVKMKKELALIDGVAIIVGVIIGSGIFVSPKGVLRYSGSVGQAIIVWIMSGILSMVGALCYAELGLFDGVCFILNTIFGIGIFITPGGILRYAGSVGLSLIIWILSGLIAILGAACYAELGTMIPKSGGDYAYVHEAFGPLPAFLYLWVALFVLVPTGNAITAITFAQYILQPLWPTCAPPYEAVRLIAAFTVCLLTIINCYNVKWVTRVQDSFTATKIFALGIIVVAGFWYLFSGHTEHFQDPMAETNTKPGSIALAFYSGLFSYSGWNYLNYVTEELKEPYRNLPRAICISMPIVTITYVVTNIAYFVVLSREDLLASNAVAVTFGDKMLGGFSFVIPIFVACSTFGSLNGAIFASSRLFFVGARQGHLPRAIALIDVKRFTPVPSLVFMCLITLLLTVIEDVYVLINCVSFVEALFIMLSVAGLVYLRYKQPDLHRPIKVNLALPIAFFIICTLLVTCPFFENPTEVTIGLIFVLCGIPVYYVTIAWTNKPRWLRKVFNSFNDGCAKLFVCMPEDAHTD